MWVSVISAICARGIRDRLDDPFHEWLEPKSLLLATFEPARKLLAHHQIDCMIELPPELRSRLFPYLAHPLVECGCRELGVPLDLALGHSLEPLGLPSLELDQRQLEPCPGVGLGLFLAKKIADVHGWPIAVTSLDGRVRAVVRWTGEPHTRDPAEYALERV